MISNTDCTERLYLSKKSGETIYIDNCKIPQHHIDGIRFLYRQYKKKNPGIIINDGTGYGRNVAVVLFIKAMHQLLKQPVLILCQEGAEHVWMEQFQTWTDLCDDVVLENQKPHIKKQVLINTMSNLPSFCGRNWSLLVVDVPEIDKTALQVLRLPFKVDYKVWITPIDVRKDLDHFSKIYKWLYPKGEFNQTLLLDTAKFIPDRNNKRDVLDKAILLSAFMEDIVVRNFVIQTSDEDIPKVKSPLPRISLKNKDATGTKIKRSKRKINDEDDDDDVPLSKSKKDQPNPEGTTHNHDEIQSKEYKVIDNISIVNFKRKSMKGEREQEIEKEKDIERERKNSHEHQLSDKEESYIDTINSQDSVKLVYESDSPSDNNSDKVYEMDTQVYDSDVSDKGLKVNESVNVTKNNDLEHKEDVSKETNLGIDDNNDIGFYIQDECKDSKENNMSTESPSIFEMKSENNDVIQEDIQMKSPLNDNESKENNMSTESPSIFEMKSENNDDIQENVQMESSLNDNEFKPNINELTSRESSICDEVTDDIASDNKVIVLDEVNNELNKDVVATKMDSPVTNTLKPNCIEDKIKEMEEKAMKKYKGSIFDSLF